LVEDGAIPHAITVHQHKTAREADEIIREAAWAAAVKALEAKGLK
jgi:hypothetical protein